MILLHELINEKRLFKVLTTEKEQQQPQGDGIVRLVKSGGGVARPGEPPLYFMRGLKSLITKELP